MNDYEGIIIGNPVATIIIAVVIGFYVLGGAWWLISPENIIDWIVFLLLGGLMSAITVKAIYDFYMDEDCCNCGEQEEDEPIEVRLEPFPVQPGHPENPEAGFYVRVDYVDRPWE